MSVRRFMDRLPNDVIIAGRYIGNDGRVLDFVFHVKFHPVADGNRIRDLQTFQFEFALQSRPEKYVRLCYEFRTRSRLTVRLSRVVPMSDIVVIVNETLSKVLTDLITVSLTSISVQPP